MQKRNGLAAAKPVPVLGAAIPRERRLVADEHNELLSLWTTTKRIPWLVVCFWTLVLTLALIAHVMRTPEERDLILHGHQRFALKAKLNVPLPLGGRPYAALLSFQICCAMTGGHMECPAPQDVECNVMRDEGPRLECYWVAPRLEGASCVIYWVVEK